MALPIGEGQTISPPFIVAYMTEAIDPQPTDKVLEIGTGSGYQAAVLSQLVQRGVHHRDRRPAGTQSGEAAGKAALRQRPRQGGRRLPGLAGTRPLRQDHRHLLAGKSAAGLGRTTQGRRPDGDSRGRAVSADALSAEEDATASMVAEALQPTLFVPMTGQAEASREVRPDPTRPSIENGGFESVAGDPPRADRLALSAAVEDRRRPGRPGGRALRHVQQRPAGPQQSGPARICRRRAEGRRSCSFRRRCAASDIRPGQNCAAIARHRHQFLRREPSQPSARPAWAPGAARSIGKPRAKRINVPPKAREAISASACSARWAKSRSTRSS